MNNTKHILTTNLQKLTTFKNLQQTHAQIIKSGLYTDPIIISNLLTISTTSPFGCLNYAQTLFNDTLMDNVYHCNIMIRAFSKCLFPVKGIELYNKMRLGGVGVDGFSYTFVMKACAAAFEGFGYDVVKKGFEVHAAVFRSGFGCDWFVQNVSMFMYGKFGMVGIARKVFDEMTVRNVNCWNIMVSAYDQAGEFELGGKLFELMPVKNVVSWNTLLGRYVRFGDVVSAKRVFDEMPERDSVSWNSMIAGYVQVKDYERALGLFREMGNASVDATEVTLISILGVCAETGALEVGKDIHQALKNKENRIEGYLGNALLDMYAKSGNMDLAREVFDALKMKHVTCWNAMIVGLAIHGYSEEALKLFRTMETRPDEVTPNRITFMGVLTACSHKGLVEEGRFFFKHMTIKYNIQPDIKHYGCIVDLLSRSGLLSEAFVIIQKATLERKTALWRTLLGSCRIYSNVELAEKCFSQLSQPEENPTDGDHVLLSNIYAEAGKWHDVQRVRYEMIDSKVVKKSGSSNIVGNLSINL